MPTTAEITKSAHRTASLGSRIFPSVGLTVEQICEAIKEHNLSPIVFRGALSAPDGFRRERFASSCAALIRSGYPVLIVGAFVGGSGQHAICAVGFRSCPPSVVNAGDIGLQDSSVEYLFIHDDNLGPNVRFKVADTGPESPVTLIPDAPPSSTSSPDGSPISGYPELRPYLMLVAAHNDIRTSPDTLHSAGIKSAFLIVNVINGVMKSVGFAEIGLTVSTRYVKLAGYLSGELEHALGGNPKVLGKVRLCLVETAPPMSLHLGVVRIGLDNSTPLIDVLYDTTDSDRNHPAFAHVCYQPLMPTITDALAHVGAASYGTRVDAF